MKLSEAVSKNRAEEFPDDLWGLYVLPLDYELSNLHKLTKGAVIEGGRGSGKTMYLKYHCHATMFSKNRTELPENILDHIGIYWKPDTSFTQIMNEKWLEGSWQVAFNSYTSLCVISELCKLCKNIYNSNYSDDNLKESLANVMLPKVLARDLGIESISLLSALSEIRSCIYTLTNWINFPDTETPPFRLSIKPTIELILEQIRQSHPKLLDTTFHVLIDEFENLSSSQQKIINTLLKHSNKELIFSIAYKRNAKVSNDTLSQEKIVDTNDFRRIDLESIYLDESNPKKTYDVLASEILTLKFFEASMENKDDKNKEIILNYSNPNFLNRRKDPEYQDYIKKSVRDIFASTTLPDISKLILSDKVLNRKLKESLIIEGLKKHNEKKLNPEDFIDIKFPEASIVNGAILNRNTTDVRKLKEEFDKYRNGESTPYTSWISNNLYGVILYIYNTLPKRECPLYVGFNQFIRMSKGNLRYFLELCYQTFSRAETSEKIGNFTLPVDLYIQGKAAKATSTAQLEKIEELGSNGIYLKRLAKRLGTLFALSQKRRSQSEPEVNHFTISTSDISSLDEETKKLLNEATVWSVLFETKGTKTKSNSEIEMTDYVLHPVLACHFGISPRKKRKLKFNADEIKTICYGLDEDFKEIQSKFVKQWDLEVDTSISVKLEETQTSRNGQYSLL
ncbi:hypothetical protein AB6C71_06390 [Vibrio splendidus]